MLDERHHFAQLLEALEQHLDALIVVGGWATRLYRLHDDVSQVDFNPLTTADADFVLPEVLSTAGININDALSNAGFEARMWGDETPPVTHYVASDGGFEIEFITHKKGGLETRSERNVTASIGGVAAQRLGNVRMSGYLSLNRRRSPSDQSMDFPSRVKVSLSRFQTQQASSRRNSSLSSGAAASNPRTSFTSTMHFISFGTSWAL